MRNIHHLPQFEKISWTRHCQNEILEETLKGLGIDYVEGELPKDKEWDHNQKKIMINTELAGVKAIKVLGMT